MSPGRPRAVATHASPGAPGNSMSCWSSCVWGPIAGRRARSGSTSMRPMTRYTVIGRVGSSMGPTGAPVTCRCLSSVARPCCARGCALRTGRPWRVASRSSRASWGKCAVTGPTRASASGVIRAFAANRSCAGARTTASTLSWDWRATSAWWARSGPGRRIVARARRPADTGTSRTRGKNRGAAADAWWARRRI